MKFGFNGVLYVLTTGTRASWGGTQTNGIWINTAPASLVKVGGVRDLSTDEEDEDFDATTRDGAGYEIHAPTLTKLPINFDLLWNYADTGQAALLTAKLTRTVIGCAVLDGDKTTSGSQGAWADFMVQKWQKGEKLREGQIINVTLFPGVSAVAPQKVQVT